MYLFFPCMPLWNGQGKLYLLFCVVFINVRCFWNETFLNQIWNWRWWRWWWWWRAFPKGIILFSLLTSCLCVIFTYSWNILAWKPESLILQHACMHAIGLSLNLWWSSFHFLVYIAFAIFAVCKSEGCYHQICHRERVLNGVLYNVKGVWSITGALQW
jgi:hypothetical protein